MVTPIPQYWMRHGIPPNRMKHGKPLSIRSNVVPSLMRYVTCTPLPLKGWSTCIVICAWSREHLKPTHQDTPFINVCTEISVIWRFEIVGEISCWNFGIYSKMEMRRAGEASRAVEERGFGEESDLSPETTPPLKKIETSGGELRFWIGVQIPSPENSLESLVFLVYRK